MASWHWSRKSREEEEDVLQAEEEGKSGLKTLKEAKMAPNSLQSIA